MILAGPPGSQEMGSSSPEEHVGAGPAETAHPYCFLCLYNEGVKTEIEVLRWGLYLAFRVDEITCTLLCFNILM